MRRLWGKLNTWIKVHYKSQSSYLHFSHSMNLIPFKSNTKRMVWYSFFSSYTAWFSEYLTGIFKIHASLFVIHLVKGGTEC